MRKASKKSYVLIFYLLFACVAFAAASFRFQGRLTDQQGRPVVGDDVRISFSLYDTITGGTALVTFSEQSVTTNDAGLFATDVDNPALLTLIKNNPNLYLQISVRDTSGFKPLSPRQKLGTVPASLYSEYALTAGTADSVADNSVTSQKIKDGEVSGADLAPDSVSGAHLAGESVGSSALSAESVQSRHLSAGSVQAIHLSSMVTIGSVQISSGAIQTYHITDNAIRLHHISDASVASSQLVNASVLNEDLANNSVSSTTISENAVATHHLQEATIVGNKIAAETIQSNHLAQKIIQSKHLAPNSVQSFAIQDGAISEVKLATASIQTWALAEQAVSANKIQDGSITANKLSGSILSTKVYHGVSYLRTNVLTEIKIPRVDIEKSLVFTTGYKRDDYWSIPPMLYFKDETTLNAFIQRNPPSEQIPSEIRFSVISYP